LNFLQNLIKKTAENTANWQQHAFSVAVLVKLTFYFKKVMYNKNLLKILKNCSHSFNI